MKPVFYLLFACLLFSQAQATPTATWYNASWNNRVPIQVLGLLQDEASENIPIYVNVTWQPGMNWNFSDLRATFYNVSSGQPPKEVATDYWFEETPANASFAQAWIRVPTVDGGATVFLYYNGTPFDDVNDGYSVFQAGQDFRTNNSLTGWNFTGNAAWDSQGFVNLSCYADGSVCLFQKNNSVIAGNVSVIASSRFENETIDVDIDYLAVGLIPNSSQGGLRASCGASHGGYSGTDSNLTDSACAGIACPELGVNSRPKTDWLYLQATANASASYCQVFDAQHFSIFNGSGSVTPPQSFLTVTTELDNKAFLRWIWTFEVVDALPPVTVLPVQVYQAPPSGGGSSIGAAPTPSPTPFPTPAYVLEDKALDATLAQRQVIPGLGLSVTAGLLVGFLMLMLSWLSWAGGQKFVGFAFFLATAFFLASYGGAVFMVTG